MSATLQKIISDNIQAQASQIDGTVVSVMKLLPYNVGTTSPVWVVDVDVGGSQLLQDIPVKGGTDGTRKFANLGMPVKLQKNKNGRYDVIGPGDSVSAFLETITYDVGAALTLGTVTSGFTFERVSFDYYQGPAPPAAGTSRWSDGETPFPLVRVVDADGNPV